MNLFRLYLVAILFCLFAASQTGASGYDYPQFSSSAQVLLDSEVDDGIIYVSSFDDTDYEELIRLQFRYLIGQLGWYQSIAQVMQVQTQIISEHPVPGQNLIEVRYKAKVQISWDRDEELPEILEVVFPARADDQGLNDFFNRYGAKCNDGDDFSVDQFFYYFVPLKSSCPLRIKQPSEKGYAVRVHFELKVSTNNTEDKYPEYQKIWKDGKLISTIIFSKNNPGSTSNGDAGISSYNSTYQRIRAIFGRPDYISHQFSGSPGARYPVLELRYAEPKLVLFLRLEDSLTQTSADFPAWYSERTLDSDLVMYNGHSGYGQNIDRLGKLGKFTRGKYQIFFVNGCGTFAYLSDDLFKNHGAVNPGFKPSKHLDVIQNTLASYFSQNKVATAVILQALIKKEESYLQILRKLDTRQRALVDGEEDNL
jgi:hypothetical protein